MTMSDPLGDMLTRIRNGQQAGKRQATCPWSKHKEAVCGVLKDEGYIVDFSVSTDDKGFKVLSIQMKYTDEGEGVIRDMKRVSRPGRRTYSGSSNMPRFYNGLGLTIVSTPQGVMADHKARQENVGGEVLCQVF